MKIRHYLLFLCFITISLNASAQTDSSAFLRKAAIRLEQLPATEKVYLHLDKPNYFGGDTIWYKAYTVIGAHHQLSALSGVLFVELISPTDSIVRRETLHLVSGIAWGEFALPDSYKPGNYHIRAYTNWMRNAGPEHFYNQRVKIGGMQSSLTAVKQTLQANPDVQFFPEGGQLVIGVRSRVALKAINANGFGEDVKGTIEDNDGNVVTDFATQHLGMGVFAFIPQSGKTYKAKIAGPGETGFTVALPKALEEGFTMTLNNRAPDSIFVKVAVNQSTFNGQKNNAFYIIARNGGKIYYTAQAKLNGLVYAAKVAKSRFPSGIVQFTLFSQSGEPVAERIAFIKNADSLKLNLAQSAQRYAVRQPVKVSLEAKDHNDAPIRGSFSVSVINESRTGVDENAESTILNNLLLTSELKGYIEQPNYYFTNVTDETKANLDLLMLTQGYSRFEWKQALNNATPAITYQPEKWLELAGTLKTPAGKPVPNGKITLAAMYANMVIDTATDADGNFKFTDLSLPDSTKVILRARKQHNGSNVAIYVKQQDYPAVQKNSIKTGNTAGLTPEMAQSPDAYQPPFKQDSLNTVQPLKEVVIKDRPIAKPDVYNHYGTSLEYDADMKRLNREFVTIKDGLASLIPGLSFVNGKLLYEFNDAIVLIDGFEHSVDDIDRYSPAEIDNIRMISATGSPPAFNIPNHSPVKSDNTGRVSPKGNTPALLIINTKRYEGTDTASTVLKQVTIRDGRTSKPDMYNNHGAVMEYDVDIEKLNAEYVDIRRSLTYLIPGLAGNADLFYYEDPQKKRPVKFIIDGFVRTAADLDLYSPKEVESIRLVAATGLAHPTLILTTKRYAGTDTAKIVKLKQVDINGGKTAKTFGLTNSDNLNGPGNADQVIMGDKVEGCITLSDCLNGKVFGVTFKNGIPYSIRSQNRLGGGSPMVVIVDGIVMTGDHLDDLNASDVNSIEVLRSGAFLAVYGTNAPGGALVITTKRGGQSTYVTSEAPAGLITYPFNGFYKARAFYRPKYNPASSDTQKPDLRGTIYWQPNIITDKDGKAVFEYNNNDTKGIYRVVVEGIDDNGNLGRLVYRYKVE